jgi:hypothetical protein
MIIAKLQGKWVQIVKFSSKVKFSDDTDWFMIVIDWEKPFRKRSKIKWIPASTRFDSVRELIGE